MGAARRLAGGRIEPALRLVWPFVLTGVVYLAFLVVSGEWRTLLFRPRDLRPAWEMQRFYLGLRSEHPPQGKHNALQKAAYTGIVAVGAVGGYELARYWHFVLAPRPDLSDVVVQHASETGST